MQIVHHDRQLKKITRHVTSIVEADELQEECSIPTLQLTPFEAIPALQMSKWTPPRKKRLHTEDTSDSAYIKRHIRHERSEKRIVNREKEQYLHNKYRQQVAAEELRHLAINNRLASPTLENAQSRQKSTSMMTRSRRKRVQQEPSLPSLETEPVPIKKLRNRSELKVQALRKFTQDGLLSQEAIQDMLAK